jgi:hypothetical protein
LWVDAEVARGEGRDGAGMGWTAESQVVGTLAKKEVKVKEKVDKGRRVLTERGVKEEVKLQ